MLYTGFDPFMLTHYTTNGTISCCHCADTQNQAMYHLQHDIPIPATYHHFADPTLVKQHRLECCIPSKKSSNNVAEYLQLLGKKSNSQSYCHHSPNKAHIKHTIEQDEYMMLCLKYLIVEGVMGLLHICYHH